MNISMSGYGENAATFAAEDLVQAGDAVTMTGNGTVDSCAANDKPCGVAISVRGGYACVQLAGYTVLKYSGTAPVVGWQKLNANGSGGLKVDAANGRELLVVDVDTTAKTMGVIL